MFLGGIFFLIDAFLGLAWWAVILAVIVQLLVQFNVLDTRNRIVWSIADFLYRVTEPMFSRVRRFMPNLGPVDLSPLVILLLITALRSFFVPGIQMYLQSAGLYF
jgi:YggT family protein